MWPFVKEGHAGWLSSSFEGQRVSKISEKKGDHQVKKAIALLLLMAAPALVVHGQTMPTQTDENRRVEQRSGG
jgi:hypothetical protein